MDEQQTAAAPTDGPWQSQNSESLDGMCTIVGNIDGPDDGRFTYTVICEMNADAADFEANRRLVIAAPELLKALIEARRFLDYFAHGRTHFVGGGTPIRALAQVDAAIAKAGA